MKILIGGSPCTRWSIAQTKNRETEASGIGWELFLNYRIARDKYQPDYFLYENNKSMSPAIRAQITAELGVEPVLINSALVSAQNRQRIYWVGKREPDGTYSQVPVEQPEDRGILLRDILETGICWREKGYALTASSHSATAEDMFARRQRNGVAEPIRIGTIENDAKKQDFDSQQYRVYSPDGKSVTLCGNGGGVGAKTGLYAVPISAENNKVILKAIDILADRKGYVPEMFNPYNRTEITGKAPTLSTDSMVTSSCAVLIFETADGKQIPVYEVRGGLLRLGFVQLGQLVFQLVDLVGGAVQIAAQGGGFFLRLGQLGAELVSIAGFGVVLGGLGEKGPDGANGFGFGLNGHDHGERFIVAIGDGGGDRGRGAELGGGGAARLCDMSHEPHEILRDTRRGRTTATAGRLLPVLRASAAGDRARALLQQCELPKPICKRMIRRDKP